MIRNIIGHDSLKEQLRIFAKKTPQISIFAGPKGVGKKFTALNLIDEIYGGMVNVLNHPDVKIYKPEGNVFKLEMIHEIQQEAYLTPFELDRKYFILSDIDKMNKESANASLKMFEDIPLGVHFFLTCVELNKVLDTIKSRSSVLNFFRVKDLESHFPNVSAVELALADGCIGNISYIQKNGLKNTYLRIADVLNTFSLLSYSEVLDFYAEIKHLDPEVLFNLLTYCSLNLADSKKKNIFLLELLDLKPKLSLNLKIENHFKTSLLNIYTACRGDGDASE